MPPKMINSGVSDFETRNIFGQLEVWSSIFGCTSEIHRNHEKHPLVSPVFGKKMEQQVSLGSPFNRSRSTCLRTLIPQVIRGVEIELKSI
jgi:hypothetical protein